MDLETVLENEVSQKKKNKYYILTHMCGIQKNGTDGPIFKAEIETHRRREQIYGYQRGLGDAEMNWEIAIDIHTLLCIKWASLVAQMVKRPSAMQETRV